MSVTEAKQFTCNGQCDDLEQFPITMAFQPVVNVETQTIHGYEALVRGLNGESAYQVLSSVTEDNMYAFDQSCRVKAIEIAARLGLKKRLNINFMPNAVYHPTACLQKTIKAAAEHNFPSNLITFEFTEVENVQDTNHLKNIIETYRRNGYLTALDDFGAGYAGLGLLADFQPDKIKIDRHIVSGCDESEARQAILKGILQIANSLDIRVVCEGIETAAEYKYLKGLGVEYMQGYLFAKPQLERLVPESEIYWPD
ncbi:EAL domain-containing protein [Sneathiella limimaris]|uniref:EAL domain-containing protein n=1 Tax=Sneathiella limimaris TaxID=1964213 RepID=UPI00146E1D1E|nr:EAL domain-containing protein [Sneathiella limimaris]